MKNLQNEATEKAIAAEVARIQQEDGAFKRAAAAALPGPLANAFAPAKDIVVGPWKVRPFYDIDFEFLALLNHPLDQAYKDSIEGKEITAGQERALFSGKSGWQIAWMMTNSVDDVESVLLETNGKDVLNERARKGFSRLQPKQLAALGVAIMRQVAIASSTMIGYEEDEPQNEEVAKSTTNPPLSLLQKTG